MKIYELSPASFERAKSFHNKAYVIIKDNGETVLQSYNTQVCKVDRARKFVRLWDGYSVTTMRHINSFLSFMGIPGGGKCWWDKQAVQSKRRL